MSNHFSSLGFDIEDESAFAALVSRLAALGDSISTRFGTYLRWQDGSGAEVWLQVNARRELIGVNPHFSGSARLRAQLTTRVARQGTSALDGVFHAWAEPEPGEEHRVYPFLFDCPCSATYEPLALPAVRLLQVAAFAHEVEVYATPEAFELAQRDREPKRAIKSFVPAGLFRSPPDDGEPQSTAVLTGSVVASAEHVNGLTGAAFHWARVQSLGGEFDVVFDSALAPVPPVGGVVTGYFWLTAKVVSE